MEFLMNKNMIAVQDEYVETVNAGFARWSHRKDGGHFSRIRRGAWHRAEKALSRIGYNASQISQIIKDADDMAILERNSNQ
jgi:hypothetical protein